MNATAKSSRRAFARAAFCLLVLGSAMSCAWAQAGAPRVLRLGIGTAADSTKGRAVQELDRRLSAYTNGSLRVELHADGKLGNDVSMTKAASDGQLEMTAPDSSTLAAMDKRFSAINYPFTFNNNEEVDTILDGPWGQQLLDGLSKHKLVGLAFWENGFRQMTNSRRPMSVLGDFQGVRMRVMQNPMLEDSFAKLGFTAVPLPFTKVYEAMKSHHVDGQENPLGTILSSRFYEVQPYLTLSRHVYSAHVVVVSQQVWQSLSPAHQDALRRATRDARDFGRKANRDSEVDALTALKAKGMTVTSISRADGERIRYRLRDVFDKYNQEIGFATMVDLYVRLGQLRSESTAGSKPKPIDVAQREPAPPKATK
ncbi:MAG: DctP family TRAP transporter solute-binding subunit [Proteobacteria bacterium]|nr:DctP family TRAP transporter solute-binding subunit [Pseudomonadota bacterium]